MSILDKIGPFYENFKDLTTTWIVTASVSATMDKFFSYMMSSDFFFGSLLCLSQLTISSTLSMMILLYIDPRMFDNPISIWVAGNAIWDLSPVAVETLQKNFHLIHSKFY